MNNKWSHHIELSQCICYTNRLTGFYMMGTVVLRRKYFRVRILPLIVEFDKVFALRGVLKNVFRSKNFALHMVLGLSRIVL